MDTRSPFLAFLILLAVLLILRGAVAVIDDVRRWWRAQRQAAHDAAERAVGFCDVPALHRALRAQWWPPRRLTHGSLNGLMRDAIHRGHIQAIEILGPHIHCGGEGSASMIAAALVRWTYRPDVLDAVLDAVYSVEQMRANPLRKSDIVLALRPGIDAAQRLGERMADLDRAAMRAVIVEAHKPTDEAKQEPAAPARRRRM
jgi:hypothetical protein